MDEWFSHTVRVRFAETDAQGIAHHASYVVWLEEARVAHLAAVAGGYTAIRERGIEALTTGIELTYERGAVFDDVLTVRVGGGAARGGRSRTEYVAARAGARAATGSTRHATIDAVTRRPVRVPDWLLGDLLSGSGTPRP